MTLLWVGFLAEEARTPLPAATGSMATLSEQEAVAAATEWFLEDCGFEEDQLADFRVDAAPVAGGAGEAFAGYAVSFTFLPEPLLVRRVSVLAPSGRVAPEDEEDFSRAIAEWQAMNARDAAVREATRQWEAERGPYCFWSYQDKAAFSKQYGSEPGRFAWKSAIALPEAGDISLVEAMKRAERALAEEFSLTPAQMDAMRKDVAFYEEWCVEAVGETRCWLILYRGETPREDGAYPLLYQALVPSPEGPPEVIHNFEEDSLMALGLSRTVASKLTELPSLYYVPSGGRFYHIWEECVSVPPKYLPMKEFPTGKLDQPPFRELIPCIFCVQ